MSRKKIEIDNEVYSALERRARPFIDKEPNDVLRRLLALDGAGLGVEPVAAPAATQAADGDTRRPREGRQSRRRTSHTRAKKGTLLEESAYWMPILHALDERGGRGAASEIVNRVGELIDDQMLPADREKLETGVIRWQARTQFARLRMKEEGLIERDSPRGIWEITDKGKQHLLAGNTTTLR